MIKNSIITTDNQFLRSIKIPSQKTLNCFFVSDMHGNIKSYQKLFQLLLKEKPDALFIGGDILPSPFIRSSFNNSEKPYVDFINEFLVKEFIQLKNQLGDLYPKIFIILGNDDAKMEEFKIIEAASAGVWEYCHNKRFKWQDFYIYGYSYIPPSPFRLKDWEHFDVTDYVRPGCISPLDEKSFFTVGINKNELKKTTIEKDLQLLTGTDNLNQSIFLFHSPPHHSQLDRAALDRQCINDIQVDIHVGSVAIQRFIKKRQPLITLHGHIHESTRLTGNWKEIFDKTYSFNASHDGPELSLIRFDPYSPHLATRELIS